MELVGKISRDQAELNVTQHKKVELNLVEIRQIRELDYQSLKTDTQALKISIELLDLELILQVSKKMMTLSFNKK